MLWVSIVTNVVALVALPAWAMLADRIGRKPVFIFGAIGSGALMFAYLGAIASADSVADLPRRDPHVGRRLQRHERRPAVALRRDVPDPRAAVGHRDRHPDRLRHRRLRPDRGRGIAGDGPDGWVPVAAYVLVSSLIAAVAVATARETCKLTLDEIDGRRPAAPTPRFARQASQREASGAGVR